MSIRSEDDGELGLQRHCGMSVPVQCQWQEEQRDSTEEKMMPKPSHTIHAKCVITITKFGSKREDYFHTYQSLVAKEKIISENTKVW